MQTDRRGLAVLTFDECLRRLRLAAVGRVAFVHDGSPVILPVSHGLDGANIVFRTTWGSKLAAAEGSWLVAFEVDGFDPDARRGWSVLARGVASRVYDARDIERYDRLGVQSWTELGDDVMWVTIRPDEVTGREIVSPDSTVTFRSP